MIGPAPQPKGLDRVLRWFDDQGWTPWPFQLDAWHAHAQGRSGLVNVPTGAGKTYAAFMGPLASMLDEHAERRPLAGIRLLYVTPLRAVARDIEAALRRPLTDLAPRLTAEGRTGDTRPSLRAKQRERLPNVLITTPESLSLLLTRDDAATLFAPLSSVVLDEWHELVASKRGTQCELALARLRRIAPALRTWALSATLANLDVAASAAVGTGRDPAVIRGRMDRPLTIRSLLPPEIARFPWAGHLGLAMLPQVLDAIDTMRSTLIFTNTRSQAELWHSALLAARPAWAGFTGLHHGSIDRGARERVERGLKDGSVRLVVATSSLDLGVDFAPVEVVFQVGSPKGVARLLQRAGRSAHRPNAPCAVTCVPTNALELVEIAAVRRAVAAGEIEPRLPPPKPLDVLAQHMVTRALGGGFTPDGLFHEVRDAWSYRDLSRADFDWTLELVRDGGACLHAYPEHHRIESDRGLHRVPSRRTAQLHRLNVGTITAEATLELRLVSGRRLGTIEDHFIASLAPGDRFLFAGKTLRYVGLHDLTALVRPDRGKTRLTPHWAGTRLPISESLAQRVRSTLASPASADEPELRAAAPVLDAQRQMSHLPDAGELLVETTNTREGAHLFLYPFDGRLVHGGLAAILALRLTRLRKTTFALAVNDYGLELLTTDDYPFAELFTPSILAPDHLAEDAIESMNLSDLARLQFREIARVAGLVHPSHPGARKTSRHLQASAGLIYDVFREFDPGNLLLEQARREVLDRQFEHARLARTLERLAQARIVLRRVERPTPLAFPLVVQRSGVQITAETLAERVEKMRLLWENGVQPTPPPSNASSRRRRPRSRRSFGASWSS
ncbi:MAG: ligase-associated DNA damage response DEXH box helicase [Phycisphaerae bacterium]|nr:ligase-associated DNA damage response DEXH box helicase [Phycisphaerae bacterium]